MGLRRTSARNGGRHDVGGPPQEVRRRGTARRGAVATASIVVWGAALAVVAVVGDGVRFYIRFAPVAGVAALGVVAAASAGGVLWVRRRTALAAASATAAAAEEHRRFLRRLDHELKNPLTAMRLGLTNVAAAGAPAAAQDPLRSVTEQVARLTRITGGLRKLVDIESQPLSRGPVDVGLLLEEAAATARELPGGTERHVDVSVPRVPWPLPTPSGDASLLELALENLVTNAVKYSGPGARIELRAFEEDDHVVVEVADTGQGIPDDELPYVWGELVRGRDALATPGSGLGLALVHAVVQRHGGRCDMRSLPAAGTVVRLRLPIG
ncbi:sensor histidine kinase [Yinghuangia sp. YIM S10712]|uniref:sensor histidine kinase n=1 Tax=Yinghuangia sp. YIM S10712 TaxID=3436930 RepID=UPI003F52E349